MSFVIFSAVEDGLESFKLFNFFEEIIAEISVFFLSALAGREQDSSLGEFFPPANFEKLLKRSLLAKKLSWLENYIEISFDIGGERLFQVKKCEHNNDVEPHFVCITITLLENGSFLRELKINCVKIKFEQFQQSLKD